MFFDDHPRFLETSNTGNQLSRLNWRHKAVIEDNVDLLQANGSSTLPAMTAGGPMRRCGLVRAT